MTEKKTWKNGTRRMTAIERESLRRPKLGRPAKGIVRLGGTREERRAANYAALEGRPAKLDNLFSVQRRNKRERYRQAKAQAAL